MTQVLVNAGMRQTDHGERGPTRFCLMQRKTCAVKSADLPPIRQDGWASTGFLRGVGQNQIQSQHKTFIENV
jgi:hypothetical protein